MKTKQTLLLSLALVLNASITILHGQVLNPQQISGTVRFNNSNPAILNLLTNSASQIQTYGMRVYADAQPPASPAETTFTTNADALIFSYQMTVDTGTTGIVYKLTPNWYTGPVGAAYNVNDTFVFSPQYTPLLTTPGSPATVNFSECAGVLDVHFVTSGGAPVPIQSLAYQVYPLGSSTPVATAGIAINPGTSVTNFDIVVPGGGTYKSVITYGFGTNKYLNTAQYTITLTNTVSCDQVLATNVAVPTASQLANVTGFVGLAGQFAMTLPDWPDGTPGLTTVGAYQSSASGNQNFRYAALRGTNFIVPASGPFVLTNLVPTTGLVPAATYDVYASMVVNSNRSYVLFTTPWLGSGQNPGLSLAPGATVTLSNLFAITPGYLNTSFNLRGPAESVLGHLSGLRNLVFGLDTNQNDGIPLQDAVYGDSAATFANMIGVDTLAPGASYTASGGSAATMGVGGFNPLTASYESQVLFPLGGLNSQPSIWKKGQSTLWIIQAATNGLPYIYQNSYIRDISTNTITVIAGQTNSNQLDFSYGLSEVQVNIHSTSGQFSSPQISGSGSYSGLNYLGKSDNYSFYVLALGSPSYPTNIGSVVMYLPQGTYTLSPEVQSGGSQTTLQPLTLTVGSGQHIVVDASSSLQVQLSVAACASTPLVYISGQVIGTNAIQQVTVSVNGGPPSVICTGCGPNPIYNFPVNITASPCTSSTITVTAMDMPGNTASTTTSVRYNPTVPIITSCPGNITVPCTGLPGTPVSYSGSAVSSCDGAVSVNFTPPSGSLFPPGTNQVIGIAVDSCGNQSSPCIFTVTVQNTNPPVINCPSNITVGCAGQGGAPVTFQVTATDGCDTNITILCAPPSGSVFPLGTNIVNCTAHDSFGNTSFCSFLVYVQPAVLSITKTVTIQWCGGALQGADNVNGPWTDIPGATSPYTVATDKARQFYRSH
jgi:hypothetical protein